jgi:hypothetical protein
MYSAVFASHTYLLLHADGIHGGGSLGDDSGAARGLAGPSRDAGGERNLAGLSEGSHGFRECGNGEQETGNRPILHSLSSEWLRRGSHTNKLCCFCF